MEIILARFTFMAHLVIVVTGGNSGVVPSIYSVWDESEPVKALVESRTAMVFINLPEYREESEDRDGVYQPARVS